MNLKRIAYNVSTIAATGLLGGAIAIAQQPMPGQQPSMPSQQPQQPTNPNANPGTPGAYPGTSPTANNEFGEKAFVSQAMEGDNVEVQLGQLAQQKSQSQDVKQLAQKLASDHSQMNQKWFDPEAKQLGLSEPNGPSKKDKKMMSKLEGLSGSAFDTQYLTMMYKDHQKDLKDYKDEVNSTQDPNVKQLAQQGSKVIAQHLQLIEQVAKNHNITLGENSKQTPSM
jgi:putative membrane protein